MGEDEEPLQRSGGNKQAENRQSKEGPRQITSPLTTTNEPYPHPPSSKSRLVYDAIESGAGQMMGCMGDASNGITPTKRTRRIGKKKAKASIS